MKYDQKDFELNPKKYELFKTAVVATNIFTHDGWDDLRQGEIVAIRYAGEYNNPLYRRKEPMYQINDKKQFLYANYLSNFVL